MTTDRPQPDLGPSGLMVLDAMRVGVTSFPLAEDGLPVPDADAEVMRRFQARLAVDADLRSTLCGFAQTMLVLLADAIHAPVTDLLDEFERHLMGTEGR